MKWGVIFSQFKSSKLRNFSNSFFTSRSIISFNCFSVSRIRSGSKQESSLHSFSLEISVFFCVVESAGNKGLITNNVIADTVN